MQIYVLTYAQVLADTHKPTQQQGLGVLFQVNLARDRGPSQPHSASAAVVKEKLDCLKKNVILIIVTAIHSFISCSYLFIRGVWITGA